MLGRGKFGPVFVMVVMGALILIFVFSGVFSPRATRGLHEGAVAGTVNGDAITMSEFNREYTRRMEFFKQMAGGKISEQQLKMFRIKDGVFSELANHKLMSQAAEKEGLLPSDEEVRQKITEIPVFQKNGAFDPQTYKEILAANNLTPSGFESQMRDDIGAQAWNQYFSARVHVSPAEVKKEFLVTHDRKNLKYVLLTQENGAKGVLVTPEEEKKFLAEPGKMNLVKSRFDAKKNTEYKGKELGEVQDSIARGLVASEKGAEIAKVNQKVADQIVGLMTAQKTSDAKINAILKSYGAEVKYTGPVNRESAYIPGIGESKDVTADLWKKDSPLDSGKAKIYHSAAWILVAIDSEHQAPDLTKLAEEENSVRQTLLQKKEREVYENWIKDLNSHAKIDKNPSVVGDDEEAGTS